jgi:hypothetical protein
VPSRRNRLGRGLRRIQTRGVRRGIYGRSRGWFWVAVVAFVVRRLRRAFGGEYELVYRGEVKPGESIQINHLTRTYEGKPVRSRRRETMS